MFKKLTRSLGSGTPAGAVCEATSGFVLLKSGGIRERVLYGIAVLTCWMMLDLLASLICAEKLGGFQNALDDLRISAAMLLLSCIVALGALPGAIKEFERIQREEP